MANPSSGFAAGLAQILLPKGKGTKGGVGFGTTFNPVQPLLALPQYRDHLTDLYTGRTVNDSRALIALLANMDPDISAAIHAFLAVAGTVDPIIYAYDANDVIDLAGITMGQQLLALMTTTNDYTAGFSNKPTVDGIMASHRYMTLLRGGTAGELVLDKTYVPSELRMIDPATLLWYETGNGIFDPKQRPIGSAVLIDLNIPTFFTANFHQSPLSMYWYSPFVSAINTIASRTLVVNELYRIMKVVGYPRVDIQVLEDVLMNAAPAAFRNDPIKIRAFVEAELARIRAAIANLASADAFVHSSAITAKIINDKNPTAGLQIENIISVLDAQNQAALKVMPAVVGKGSNGQVASTEARLFALSADALNRTVAELFSKALTLAARLAGYPGRIECVFPPVELRPDLELEPQKTMRAGRLKADLSEGIISDLEYSMAMYRRPPLPGAPPLSGTQFLNPQPAIQPDVQKVTPNSDPLGRSLSGEGGNGVGKNNQTKPQTKKPAPAKP